LTWLDFSEKEGNQGVSELKYSQNPLAAELFICTKVIGKGKTASTIEIKN
jgi:hypothetical protein